MAATPFNKIISWSPNQPITDDKLNAMVSNDNWLFDNMVRGSYRGAGVNTNTGVKIAGGLALVTARKPATATVNVNFGGFFSNGCKPVVTTGIVSKAQRRIFATVDGPGNTWQPTRDGFQIHVEVDVDKKTNKKISRNFYVSWHALGY